MPCEYHLSCQNNSQISSSFCVFQTLVKNDPTLALLPKSVAWLTKKLHPRTNTVFAWQDDLFFVWGEYISPNLINTAQKIKADLEIPGKKSVSLSYEDDAYLMKLEKRKVAPDKLLITTDDTVASGDATVGLGGFVKTNMVRSTIVYDVAPNTSYLITPKVEYFVTFGNYVNGQLIYVNQIHTPYAKIPFSPEKRSFTAVMRPDNQLVVRRNTDWEDALLET